MFQDLIPGSPKFSKAFDGKAHSKALKVFDICLELPSDSERYFGLLLTSFPSLCILENRDVYLWLDRPVRNIQNLYLVTMLIPGPDLVVPLC